MTPDALARRSAEEVVRLLQKSADLSVDIEAQIKNKDGPLNFILASAFQEAVDAMLLLVDADPTNVDKIRQLQNEVRHYADIERWLANAVVKGEQARRELERTDIPDGWESRFSIGEDEVFE